jgi:NAD(P)-dependent dehydrogenase (short-subunit alcohol dehydrogenase family)
VTGGTRGIGAAIAATLARRGANVVISARAPADELPDGVRLVLADASTTEGAKHLAARPKPCWTKWTWRPASIYE